MPKKKTGRPKKPERRERQIAFRVSRTEYAEIAAWAQAGGFEVGTELRRLALEKARGR